MRRVLTIASLIPMMLTGSCAVLNRHQPHLSLGPPKPLPAWTADDFDCGSEPKPPPKTTTHGVAEGYQTDTLEHSRTCETKLKSRGADASRYGLIAGTKTK